MIHIFYVVWNRVEVQKSRLWSCIPYSGFCMMIVTHNSTEHKKKRTSTYSILYHALLNMLCDKSIIEDLRLMVDG